MTASNIDRFIDEAEECLRQAEIATDPLDEIAWCGWPRIGSSLHEPLRNETHEGRLSWRSPPLRMAALPPEGPESPDAQPGPRIMHGPDAPPFQVLRRSMEDEWTPQLMETLDIDETSLPVIWDADFLYGPRDAVGADTYVPCEINVSSCFAIPDEAPAAIARTVKARILQSRKASSSG
jgi:hypothetical protein